eukprot:g38847.t1
MDRVEKQNSTGTLLLTECHKHNLLVTNALFRQRDKYKTKYQHQCSKCWHLLHCVIVRARDQKDIKITPTMTGADDCWIDHHLIRARINITTLGDTKSQDSTCLSSALKTAVINICKKSHTACHKLSNTPALHEVEKAICKLKNNKAAGADSIPAEALKCGGKEFLLQLLLQEKCREKNLVLYMSFFDLTKAFDAVNREKLWSVILHFGCTMKFITILRLLHDDMEVMIMTNDSTTDPFPIQTSVKQGCIITPTLFLIYLIATLQLATDKHHTG